VDHNSFFSYTLIFHFKEIYSNPIHTALLQYVSAPNYLNKKIVGFLYTEDDYPFSNKFRPSTPANLTATIQMSVGDIATIPSSTYLFYNWFNKKFNYTPTYPTVMVWAAFDVLEKSLYIAAMQPKIQEESFISPADCFTLLLQGHCSTPFGLVAFDANRINTGYICISHYSNTYLLLSAFFVCRILFCNPYVVVSFK
jgi:hypothetical protein